MGKDTFRSATSDSRYGDIIKSTSLIGASSIVNIAVSIVRLKVLAVYLGPGGIALFGIYNVILDLASSSARRRLCLRSLP